MTSRPAPPPTPRVLFRAAAGSRTGYGHLVRAVWLAEALGVAAWVSVRGSAAARRVARRLGCAVALDREGFRPLRRAALVVIDDPCTTHAGRWCAAAGRVGVPVASIHDLGLGLCESDLLIDGSVARNDRLEGRRHALIGPRFAILDPALRHGRGLAAGTDAHHRVLIALGGGRRALLAGRLARRIVGRRPDVHVAIAGGLEAGHAVRTHARIEWLRPSRGLADALASTTLAIVGGGVTTYEVCGLGVAAVSVAVVAAQRPTVRAFAEAGAVLDGGTLPRSRVPVATLDHLVDLAVGALDDEPARRALSRAGRAIVDGRGAERVADRLRRILAAAASPSAEAA